MSGGPAERGGVVTLGECMASFVPLERGPFADIGSYLRTTIAGAEANVAVGISRLGHPSAYIGRVGDDGLGRLVLRRLRGEAVDVRHLRIDAAAPTGVMIRELRDVGPAEVMYLRSRSAGSRLSADDVEAAAGLFEHAEWLHLTGITPALSATAAAAVHAALGRARSAGLSVSLDLNLRRRLWSEEQARPVLASLAGRCDTVLGGLEEVAVVGGLAATLDEAGDVDPEAAADALLDAGCSRVVVKLGAQGAIERRADGAGRRTAHAPALPVAHVADPLGAGDAFSAGYIAARLGSREGADALAWGNACGAAVVACVGDQAGLPTAAELGRLLARGGMDTLR